MGMSRAEAAHALFAVHALLVRAPLKAKRVPIKTFVLRVELLHKLPEALLKLRTLFYLSDKIF